MLATEYASCYGIDSQRDNESDAAFRDRVSGALHDMGHIIEANAIRSLARLSQMTPDEERLMVKLLGGPR